MSQEAPPYRAMIVPMHPGHQYLFCRVGFPTAFLGHWQQFSWWRPQPENVRNLSSAFDEAHLGYGLDEYRAWLSDGSIDLARDFDFAFIIFGWQWELFRDLPIRKVYHASKYNEINPETWGEMLAAEDTLVCAYYPNTVEDVERLHGRRIPYIPAGLDPDEYVRGPETVRHLLTVIHSWKDRGWHHQQFLDACGDLPYLHIDHFDRSKPVYNYDMLRREFKRAQVYFHDGEQEYTIALIEAMMASCPVVSFDLPGLRRYIVHGVTGFIACNGDEGRAYCQQLLDDPALAERMGAAGRAKALAEFSEARWRDDWIEVITKFMKKQKVSARDFFKDDFEDVEIHSDDDLFAQGHLDSLSIVQLVAWIEMHCGIRVPSKDIVPANFRSIEAIDRYVDRVGGA